MNPKESTDTSTIRTSRHSSRHLEICEPSPHTSLVHTENCKVFRSNGTGIVLVCDSQCASREVVNTSRMVLIHAGSRTYVVRVIWFPYVTSIGRGEVACGAFVTGYLSCCGLACGEVEHISVVGGIIEVTMEPPLVKSHVHKRSDGSVVIRECIACHIKAAEIEIRKDIA